MVLLAARLKEKRRGGATVGLTWGSRGSFKGKVKLAALVGFSRSSCSVGFSNRCLAPVASCPSAHAILAKPGSLAQLPRHPDLQPGGRETCHQKQRQRIASCCLSSLQTLPESSALAPSTSSSAPGAFAPGTVIALLYNSVEEEVIYPYYAPEESRYNQEKSSTSTFLTHRPRLLCNSTHTDKTQIL